MSLPDFLINRYREWKNSIFNLQSSIYKEASEKTQKPSAMFISCCDSRILENSIFKAEIGDYFVHKNIANLVPRFDHDSSNTGSAIEYAVKSLNVKHIIILGHQNCGGIAYGYNLHSSKIEKNKNEYLDKWLKNLEIPFNNLPKNQSSNDQITLLEKESIKNSIDNLLTYSFVKERFENNTLKIHGLWFEIKTGNLMELNFKTKDFELIN